MSTTSCPTIGVFHAADQPYAVDLVPTLKHVDHLPGQSVTSTLKAIESFAAEKCPCQGRGSHA
eukprot:2912081-Amphidinium_carterae.1